MNGMWLAPLAPFLMIVGIGLFVGNQDLDKTLTARGIAHTFSLDPGDHGYEFVRAYLARSLKFLGAALSPATKEAK